MARKANTPNKTEHKHIWFFGAPNVGKGLTSGTLARKYPEKIEMIGIGHLGREGLKDPEFRTKYGEIIARRDLLPDEIVFRLATERYNQAVSPIVGFDGLGRTVAQIDWAEEHGFLGFGTSVALVYHATESICYERWVHRRDNQPEGPREDDMLEASFRAGYKTFTKNWPDVYARLRRTGTRIFQIDARRNLESEVFPDVLGHFTYLLSDGFQPSHRQEEVSPQFASAAISN